MGKCDRARPAPARFTRALRRVQHNEHNEAAYLFRELAVSKSRSVEFRNVARLNGGEGMHCGPLEEPDGEGLVRAVVW